MVGCGPSEELGCAFGGGLCWFPGDFGGARRKVPMPEAELPKRKESVRVGCPFSLSPRSQAERGPGEGPNLTRKELARRGNSGGGSGREDGLCVCFPGELPKGREAGPFWGNGEGLCPWSLEGPGCGLEDGLCICLVEGLRGPGEPPCERSMPGGVFGLPKRRTRRLSADPCDGASGPNIFRCCCCFGGGGGVETLGFSMSGLGVFQIGKTPRGGGNGPSASRCGVLPSRRRARSPPAPTRGAR